MTIDYGKKLFLDAILMEIMVYSGEIWCKLCATVMVYIPWRTATNNLGKDFNPPPPPPPPFWAVLKWTFFFSIGASLCQLREKKFEAICGIRWWAGPHWTGRGDVQKYHVRRSGHSPGSKLRSAWRVCFQTHLPHDATAHCRQHCQDSWFLPY